MSKPQRKPILNASLPAQFRQIRIVLAREPGHPEGDDEIAYIFVAPVDAEGRIDPKLWRATSRGLPGRAATSERSRTSLVISSITLAAPGGSTMTDETNLPDEVGYHFADERFVVGEYVSINERGKMHTYRVTTVSHL